MGVVSFYFVFLRPTYKYVRLKSDYVIEDGGLVKEGTILRVDKPFSEGFTRYILYLNLSDGEVIDVYDPERRDEIIPYWLRADSTSLTRP